MFAVCPILQRTVFVTSECWNRSNRCELADIDICFFDRDLVMLASGKRLPKHSLTSPLPEHRAFIHEPLHSYYLEAS